MAQTLSRHLYYPLMSMDQRRREIDRLAGTKMTDGQWEYLEDHEYVADDDWEAGGASAALEALRKFKVYAAPGKESFRADTPRTGWQRQRIKLLAGIYAWQASGESRVQHLRATVDGSNLRDAVTKLGMDASDVPRGPTLARLPSWIKAQLRQQLGLEPRSSIKSVNAAVIAHLSSGGDVAALWYPDGDEVRVVSVPQTGLLGELAMLAASLSEQYSWNLWDATRWIVCSGEPPNPWVFRWKPVIRTMGRSDSTTRLILEVDPTLTPDEVSDAYNRARAAVLKGDRLRPLDEKALAMVDFALEQPETEKPPWGVWQARWNQSRGDQHGSYDGSNGRSNFRRDLNSAWDRITRVGWQPPGDDSSRRQRAEKSGKTRKRY